MAQRVEVVLEDDLDGSEAAATVEFALDGASYEIDLSEVHIDELRASFAPWLEKARRTGGRRTQPTAPAPSRSTSGSTRTDPAQTAAIRSWASANGHEVSARGRIPGKVQEAFQAAHS